MAAPDFVPRDPARPVRTYQSPPRRRASWRPQRPGDLSGPAPRGDLLGSPGPDQGYALTLSAHLAGTLSLAPGEHERDALAGVAAVACKRASLFGRAPILEDLTVAATVWGLLGDAPDELVARRRAAFAEVSSPHHYGELRRLVDAVDESVLRLTPGEVAERHRRDWSALLAPAGA